MLVQVFFRWPVWQVAAWKLGSLLGQRLFTWDEKALLRPDLRPRHCSATGQIFCSRGLHHAAGV